MDSFRYYLALALLMVVPPSFIFWILVHPFIRFWRKVGAVGTYTLLGALLAVTMSGVYHARGRLLAVEFGTSLPLAVAGFGLLVVAGWMRRSLQVRLTSRILLGLPELEPEKHRVPLITGGPHGVIRHPRYVQYLLALAGWALVTNYLVVYLFCALWAPMMALIAWLEERELRERYGPEWEEYARRVPRFIPRRSGKR